ncbi:NAD(P)/FAD-dependent oxidoreductase [Pseudaestuariivita sp.]|uniref:NAD(P)/FAD-dependent oxidoreductase n=1 Tax=Pseudaestuariivita sp. TaxID=2211669 RepID=UPI004057DA44
MSTSRRKVAIVGGGISGMGAAYDLSGTHDVTLFEAEARLGGHARTVVVEGQPVDTGFIVFNHANYPHLTALFEALDVPTVPSNMSFGASLGGGKVEYGLAGLGALFAQPKNALDPRFLRMVRDILKFNKAALERDIDPSQTIGDFLREIGVGAWFRTHYLTPFSGAIWSTPVEKILDFPAHALITFFRNHNLLGVHGQHQWYTVQGGSVSYVSRLEAAMIGNGVDLRLGAGVEAVRRTPHGVELRCRGAWEAFDELVLATHSDQSLALLEDPTETERAALSAVKYQPNDATLHSDPSLMPKRKAVWSSWNYTEAADKALDRIDLTYWMNSLQPIPHHTPFFVTLNTTREIDPALVHDCVTFHHPVYDQAALQAQETLRATNGARSTWFCGAWMKNGFHEDGLASALDVTRTLKLRPAMGVAAE